MGQNIRSVVNKTQAGLKTENIIWKTWPFAHPLFYSIPKRLNKSTFPEQMHHSFRVIFTETA